ncbi:MAG: diaminopimelate decarboxylase [Anaerovoracaceae bacterium]
MTTLAIGGVDCQDLAAACGTPLYIYDEGKIEEQLRAAKTTFKSREFETEVVYAAKAFSCKAMFEKVSQADAGLDVVSGGELYCAWKSGVDMKKIYFHGNNKTPEELELAFEKGCKTIVMDNLMECEKIIAISNERKQEVDVFLRINPGIEAHTHEYIMTATPDSKFGINMGSKDNIVELIEKVTKSKYVSFKGFHSHIGSQITEFEAFGKALEIMVDFIKTMESDFKIQTKQLSIGGGFGIKYIASDKPIPLDHMCKLLIEKCQDLIKEKKVSLEKLIIEPGRSIVGEAGSTLYKIGYSKNTENKHYVFVDGGMSDNIRPALYQAEYSCDIANKLDSPKNQSVCIAGKNCESGDILIRLTKLQEEEPGDLLVIYSTGAYGYSMASNYNRAGKPPVVFAKGGKARVVIKGESYEDQLRQDTNEELMF